ncbi:MAG: site-specific integrase [Mycolicibacterium mageritense]|nr:MAG: site-specific integrase [Mycolicibacterium mageritense]
MSASGLRQSAADPAGAAAPEPVAWSTWLRRNIDTKWRPGEWDRSTWLFIGDVTNPQTVSRSCSSCGIALRSSGFCRQCGIAYRESGLTREDFLTTHFPAARKNRPGERRDGTCMVGRDGVRCARMPLAQGLCEDHNIRWHVYKRDRRSPSMKRWCATIALPYEALPDCLVPGCEVESSYATGLCILHRNRYRRSGSRAPMAKWARTQPPHLAVNMFSLMPLAESMRWELLYALQQRDARSGRMDPVAVRTVITTLGTTPSLATIFGTPKFERLQARQIRNSNASAHLFEFARTLRDAHEQASGAVHTQRQVWDLVTMGLAHDPATHGGSRRRRGALDFTPITVSWLNDITRRWAESEITRIPTYIIVQTIRAATGASQGLVRRPGGGEDLTSLSVADMDAVVEAFRTLARCDGHDLLTVKTRRTLFGRFIDLLDWGRATGPLRDMSAAFIRQHHHTIPDTDTPSEERARQGLPEPVIRLLDDNLDALASGRAHSSLTAEQVQQMFRCVYILLRDTGRRPGEICQLRADCLLEGPEPELIWDNVKGKRMGRRLPISQQTATAIRDWQRTRANVRIAEPSTDYLFPARVSTAPLPYLRTQTLADVLRHWAIRINDNVVGPLGQTRPLEGISVYAYAFRHSYAQRHADAGVPVDVLRDLMDHKSIATTMGYYDISVRRKRDAVATIAALTVDRLGARKPSSTSAYELRSVAVPFGNCTEPSNVKAGGQACPIRFQCSGCGFYRPDPSYIPAIEDHRRALKANRETARAIEAADFVIDSLTAEIDQFDTVIAAMRTQLHALDPAERQRVEDASVVLRKARAAHGSAPLPLTIVNTTDR